jgi:hypothetical protein
MNYIIDKSELLILANTLNELCNADDEYEINNPNKVAKAEILMSKVEEIKSLNGLSLESLNLIREAIERSLVKIGEEEYHTRIGLVKDQAKKLLSKVSQSINDRLES